MSEFILLDNDIALKACVYRCHGEVVAATTLRGVPPAMLRIARFTLHSRLSRPCGIADREGAITALGNLLAEVRLLDPTEAEIQLAAELEELATTQGLSFDIGESQLVAILLSRSAVFLFTGDKRAIAALAGIALAGVAGKIGCFEQLAAILLGKYEHEPMRRRVCAEPSADKAMTVCFACSSETVSVKDILDGLASYIRHLRAQTGNMLIADDDLLTVIS